METQPLTLSSPSEKLHPEDRHEISDNGISSDKRPFIFYEVGGAGGIGGSPKKNGLEGGGHLKK